jgi:hypothetical protein
MKRSDTHDFWIKIESLQWGSICYLRYKEWKYELYFEALNNASVSPDCLCR